MPNTLCYYHLLDARGDPERLTELSMKLLLQDARGLPFGVLGDTERLAELAGRRALGSERLDARLADGERLSLRAVFASYRMVRRLALLDGQAAFVFRGPECRGEIHVFYVHATANAIGRPGASQLRRALEELLGERAAFCLRPRSFNDALLVQTKGEPVEAWRSV
ncbi:MAG: hypothetical protein HYZ28_20045 [Myxococcales bacterium]|nr:hypothetical protein [Myxococcales bacterium]